MVMESASASQEWQTARVRVILRRSPIINAILDRWTDIGLADCWLVAGAPAQTVWNDAFQLPPSYGISDIDIIYFDAGDLSEEAEVRHSKRVNELFSAIPVRIEVKNEARVHRWYESKFGYPIQRYVSTEDAITTFPTTATAIGVRQETNQLRLFAPYGLADLLSVTIRANKKQITRPIYEAKVEQWLALWPELRVLSWDSEPQ